MNIPQPIMEALAKWGMVKENESMKNYTTYRTGGPADALVFPRTNDSVANIVKIAADAGVPLTVIGGGSNLLVGDGGIEGIVMRICEDDARRGAVVVLDRDTVYADAIATKESFLDFAVGEGFSGMEFMAGIPGCIGGGIMMNAGTTIGSFADILKEVDIVDAAGNARLLQVDRSMASYRKMDIGEGAIVVGARFILGRSAHPGEVKTRINDILADRGMKHPLDYPSAGSVFKNPEGHSSWKLIDEAGLKGRSVGGARVSELHTNFIINAGDATSRDIRDLISLVQETVLGRFGVELEAEIKMLGAF
ncbi:MAG: UDP-N-acetylmuramate dehydrogenase [Spirochaetes bacterium]|nr:UDP-N-acetylmuramate dehydrogenase [Spirochaetota bacterium]